MEKNHGVIHCNCANLLKTMVNPDNPIVMEKAVIGKYCIFEPIIIQNKGLNNHRKLTNQNNFF